MKEFRSPLKTVQRPGLIGKYIKLSLVRKIIATLLARFFQKSSIAKKNKLLLAPRSRNDFANINKLALPHKTQSCFNDLRSVLMRLKFPLSASDFPSRFASLTSI